MVYRKAPKPPLNIRDFVRTRDTTDDDLVKVVLEDGGELFFAFRSRPNVVSESKWRLDKQLLPENLATMLRVHDLGSNTDFTISDGSGFVGRTLRLDIESTAAHWQVALWLVCEAKIKSIRPARRPRKPDVPILISSMHSERSSDYH